MDRSTARPNDSVISLVTVHEYLWRKKLAETHDLPFVVLGNGPGALDALDALLAGDPYSDEDGEEGNDPRPAPTAERAGANMWLARDSALRTYRDPSPAEADALVRFVPEPAFGAVLWNLTDTALDVLIEALGRAHRLSPAVIAELYMRGYVQENPIPEDGEDQ